MRTYDKLRIENSFGDNFNPNGYMELAEITKTFNKITLFAKSWKNLCRDIDHYHQLAISIITHETLHTVIDDIIREDNLQVNDDHFAHLNGMDDDYANDYE